MTTISNENNKIVSGWYMVHTYSGHEDRVQQNLEQRIKTMDLKDKIFDVVVPKEEEVQIKQGEKKTVEKKMYPGYIIIHMIMDDDTWYAVRNTPGVTGFISMVDENEQRPKPVPLEKEEVDRIKGRMESDAPQVKIGFNVGEAVRIKDGPFSD